MDRKRTEPCSAGDILESILGRTLGSAESQPSSPKTKPKGDFLEMEETTADEGREGHYDLDLAEYPLFQFHTKRVGKAGSQLLRYQDTIKGPNGQPVRREWVVHSGPLGYGGPSTQALLYDLLQLYIEQGAQSSQIQFGTLRSLFLRHSQRNPSARDYDRLRRDLDILRGYDIHCQNAFWDWQRRAYVSMKWRLFESVFYFRADPTEANSELPFGFIEVSSVLRQVARTRRVFHPGIRPQVLPRAQTSGAKAGSVFGQKIYLPAGASPLRGGPQPGSSTRSRPAQGQPGQSQESCPRPARQGTSHPSFLQPETSQRWSDGGGFSPGAGSSAALPHPQTSRGLPGPERDRPGGPHHSGYR